MMRPAGKKPDGSIGRRELGRSLAALCLAACGPRPLTTTASGAGTSQAPVRAAGPFGDRVGIHSWFDLPDDVRSRELSGIAWDDATKTLWAVQDETANIVPIIPDRELKTWGFGPIITLRMSFPLDLEGLVILPDGFIVASEKGPRVLEVDRQGKLRRDLSLPEHFAKARDNRSLESLTMSPSGKFIFTTSEEALACDGERSSQTAGTRLRILRVPRGEPAELSEHAYATDPNPHEIGDYGVADLAALSDDELLVLERGWARGYGNTARIYRVNLADETSLCLMTPALLPDGPVLAKKLLVDLAKMPVTGLPPPRQKQLAPLLDNYEGLAIGPVLPDGRRSLILVSDDNGRSDQFARIVVLAVG